MKQPPNQKENLAIWYNVAHASEGFLSNKTFHITYSILKHDIERNMKKIIGILYNQNDPVKNNLLYFQVTLKLTESFNLDLLLNTVIYKLYNKSITKKVMLEDPIKKKILDQCLYILKTKTGNNII